MVPHVLENTVLHAHHDNTTYGEYLDQTQIYDKMLNWFVGPRDDMMLRPGELTVRHVSSGR